MTLVDAYRCFLAGDPAPLIGLLAEDVVYHLPGRHLGGGDLVGRAAVLHRLAESAAAFDEAPVIELLHGAAAGGFVVTVERFSARRRGRVLAQTVCVVWRMAGGACAEVWAHFEDQAACDAFWGGAR